MLETPYVAVAVAVAVAAAALLPALRHAFIARPADAAGGDRQ